MDLNEIIHTVGRISSRLTEALIELEKLPVSPSRAACKRKISTARDWMSDPTWLTHEPTKEQNND